MAMGLYSLPRGLSAFAFAFALVLVLVLVLAMPAAAGAKSARADAKGPAFSNPQFAGTLNDGQLGQLAAAARREREWLDVARGELLAPMLVPRQIGSAGYRQTQALIVTTLSRLGYAISWDNFTASTPVGAVGMANIVATRNPGAAKRLVLSAHYESKIIPGGDFVGATDAAVSVALMLDAARGLAAQIDQQPAADVSLQLVFFDGEEAYHEWTHTDSIYGSRHLAAFWEHSPDPATVSALGAGAQHRPELQRVDLMVLLDLIGASNTGFEPLQVPTAGLFAQLSQLERRLHGAGHLSRTYLDAGGIPGQNSIEDDHVPFVARSVPVLHLISVPFPKVWHKLSDDAAALDATVIRDMSVLVRSFVASYLRLGVGAGDEAAGPPPEEPVHDGHAIGEPVAAPPALSTTLFLGRFLLTLLAVAAAYASLAALCRSWHTRGS